MIATPKIPGEQDVDSKFERLLERIARGKNLSIQTRLYRLLCLAVTVVCLVIVLPANALQNLPFMVNVANVFLGFLTLFFYWQSCKGRDYPILLYLIILVMLSPVWLLNGGSHGSVTFYFLPAIMYPMVLFRGKLRWVLAGAAIVDICTLFLLEHFRPGLVHPFQNPVDRLIDIECGIATSGFLLALVLWVVITSYDRERELLSRYSTELAVSMEHLKITQNTMDAAADEIFWINPQGRVTYANTAGTGALGGALDPLNPVTVDRLASNFSTADWTTQWNRLKEAGSLVVEWTQRRCSGVQIPVEVKLTYMNVGRREYAVAFVRDIAERKQAEEARLQMERQMQHMQRLESLGVFAGGIAHDFNNMLMAIMGNLMLAKDETPQGSEIHQTLEEAENAAFQARHLTSQLLAFAKGGKPIKSRISVEAALRNSVSLVLRGSPVKFQMESSPDLRRVEADPGQIGQVFNNLIINAREAMPNGGCIRITTSMRQLQPGDQPHLPPGPYVEIKVQDSGVGISEENLSKVFDPFFSTKKRGSGLGLAVVFATIKNHQGHIMVSSKTGVGSTFTVLLPAASAEVDNPASNANLQLQDSTPAGPARKRRILLMDDEEMIRKPVVSLLAKLGFHAECAADGEQAIRAYTEAHVRGTPFDVVIMDLTIRGGMGGKQAIACLLERYPDARAVVSSGYSDDPVMSDHKRFGFVDVMAKPYTVANVQEVLARVFSGGKRNCSEPTGKSVGTTDTSLKNS